MMDVLLRVFTLLGGLAFFLYGMNVMSGGLSKIAGGSLERSLKVMTSNKLVAMLEEQKPQKVELYDVNDTIPNKLKAIVTKIYGGDGVTFTPNAKKQIKQLEEWGLDKLPVCVAKTQYSLSDNPALLGAPKGFKINVQDVRVSNGAGFIVCQTSNIMVMPGLPKKPAALKMDIDNNGKIYGLF